MSVEQYLISLMMTESLWVYGVLFLVIFCETGLVITPFLPGDSLLFIAGTLAGQATTILRVEYLFVLLLIASFAGNQVNYYLGRFFGKSVLHERDRWWCRQSHLKETQKFYQRYGKMTLVLARFVPIVRTFAPFVAGIANMHMAKFTLYNILSAVLWIGLLIGAGYFLGQIPIVQAHLSLWVYGIIIVSLLPGAMMYCKHKLQRR